MYFALTPLLPVLSRCVLSCPGCSACASGSVWLPFSCVRPLSTTPSNSIMGQGLGEPQFTWSVSPAVLSLLLWSILKSSKLSLKKVLSFQLPPSTVYLDCHKLRGNTGTQFCCGFIFQTWFFEVITFINMLAVQLWLKTNYLLNILYSGCFFC